MEREPGIYCDQCEEPCRPKFIAGQCTSCGKYLCKGCAPGHPCTPRPRAEVRAMKPKSTEFSAKPSNP